jgi:hypothetical protein
MNVLIWLWAVLFLTLAWLVYGVAGPNPASQSLLILAGIFGLLGHLADRLTP